MEASAPVVQTMGHADPAAAPIRTLATLSHVTGESAQHLAAYTDGDIAEVFQQFKVDVIGRNMITREIQAMRLQTGGAMPGSAPVAVAQAVPIGVVPSQYGTGYGDAMLHQTDTFTPILTTVAPDVHQHGQVARRFHTPPSNDPPIHPEGGNFFWRYFTGDEGCVCEHGACCKVLFCGACLHGEITEWATGQNKCMEMVLCPYFIACMIDSDRKAIEAKIHEFHVQRGDTSAPAQPYKHDGACCCAMFGNTIRILMLVVGLPSLTTFCLLQKVRVARRVLMRLQSL